MEKGILLCVDDEIIVLTALKDQLRRAFGNDFVIDVAESAEEALELLDELAEQGHKLLVIVSDWLMPGMKGDEFLAKPWNASELVESINQGLQGKL